MEVKEIPVNLPDIGGLYIAEDFGDPQKLLTARNWLSSALHAAGAVSHGAGIGGGQADIDIEVGGLKYNVSIRPNEVEK